MLPTTTTRRSMIALALVACTFSLTACDKASELGIEKIIESETDGNVNLDLKGDNGLSVQTDQGGMSVDKNGNFVITDGDGKVITGSADSDGNVSIDSDDGNLSYRTTNELPADWPADVPRPDGLTIVTATSIDLPDGHTLQIAGTTNEVARFIADYTARLTAAGFSSTLAATYDGEANWSAMFDGPYGVVLTVAPADGDDSMVGVMVLPSS